MKRIFASLDSTQFGLARSVLETAAIHCEVRNEMVSQALPNAAFASELWVRDEDYDEAARLLAGVQGEP